LRLAEAENPLIAQARQRIAEALAVQQRARSLALPSLNAGANYHGHTGNLMRSSGRVLNLSEQSVYYGGGAGALAAGTVGFPAQQGRQDYADRALPERLLLENEVRAAEEAVAVTSTRLVHRLHLDPAVRLRPVAPGVEPVTLIDPAAPLPGLIQAAVRRRPEIG